VKIQPVILNRKPASASVEMLTFLDEGGEDTIEVLPVKTDVSVRCVLCVQASDPVLI